MSDRWSSWPSEKSVEQLGGAIQKLTYTIYDKVNQADAHAQYQQGMELLRKGVIDFNNGLATDQNPEGYLDKWNTQKESIWKQATGTLKNQDALRALQDQWSAMDINQYADVTGIQTKAKINNTIDRAANTTDEISRDNTRSNDERKQQLRQLWAPLMANGIVKPEAARKMLEQYDKKIDASAMEEGLRQIGQTQGWDYALSLAQNPEFTKFFPSLDPQERDTIASKMETQVRFQQAQDKAVDEAHNAEYADKLDTAFENLNQGKANGLSFDMIGDPRGFSNTPTGERYKRTFDSMLRTWMHEKTVESRAGEKERTTNATADAMDIITNTDMGLAEKKQQLRELGSSRGVGINAVTGWIRQSRQASNNSGFNDLVKKVAVLGQGKTPILTKQQVQTITGTLSKEVENDPNVSVSKLEAVLDPLLTDAKKKNVQPVIDRLLSMAAFIPETREQSNVGMAELSKVSQPEPGQVTTPPELSKLFTDRKIGIEKTGTDSRGIRYWRGSDGRYYVVSGGRVLTLSQDGKSWQTP